MAIKFQNTRVKETILETPRENSHKETEIKLCQTFHLDNTGYKKTMNRYFFKSRENNFETKFPYPAKLSSKCG